MIRTVWGSELAAQGITTTLPDGGGAWVTVQAPLIWDALAEGERYLPTFADVTRPVNRVTVIENPRLASLGVSYWHAKENWCVIILKRYPRCLKHEIRHCLEGKWHGDKPSTEDCY